MTPQLIAGLISSSMFALGNIPMLVKAARTRSLSSYSQLQLTLVSTANVIHWVYISSLPLGPIWFLHGFHSVATALMFGWYLRYESPRRSRGDRSAEVRGCREVLARQVRTAVSAAVARVDSVSGGTRRLSTASPAVGSVSKQLFSASISGFWPVFK